MKPREIWLIVACITILVLVFLGRDALNKAFDRKAVSPSTLRALRILLVVVPLSGLVIIPYYYKKNRE